MFNRIVKYKRDDDSWTMTCIDIASEVDLKGSPSNKRLTQLARGVENILKQLALGVDIWAPRDVEYRGGLNNFLSYFLLLEIG